MSARSSSASSGGGVSSIRLRPPVASVARPLPLSRLGVVSSSETKELLSALAELPAYMATDDWRSAVLLRPRSWLARDRVHSGREGGLARAFPLRFLRRRSASLSSSESEGKSRESARALVWLAFGLRGGGARFLAVRQQAWGGEGWRGEVGGRLKGGKVATGAAPTGTEEGV
jgi:hypothetical protein